MAASPFEPRPVLQDQNSAPTDNIAELMDVSGETFGSGKPVIANRVQDFKDLDLSSKLVNRY